MCTNDVAWDYPFESRDLIAILLPPLFRNQTLQFFTEPHLEWFPHPWPLVDVRRSLPKTTTHLKIWEILMNHLQYLRSDLPWSSQRISPKYVSDLSPSVHTLEDALQREQKAFRMLVRNEATGLLSRAINGGWAKVKPGCYANRLWEAVESLDISWFEGARNSLGPFLSILDTVRKKLVRYGVVGPSSPVQSAGIILEYAQDVWIQKNGELGEKVVRHVRHCFPILDTYPVPKLLLLGYFDYMDLFQAFYHFDTFTILNPTKSGSLAYSETVTLVSIQNTTSYPPLLGRTRSLPTELLETIIGHLSKTPSALSVCARVSKSLWLPLSRHLLYSSVALNGLDQFRRFVASSKTGYRSPPFPWTHIRRLCIVSNSQGDSDLFHLLPHELAGRVPNVVEMSFEGYIRRGFKFEPANEVPTIADIYGVWPHHDPNDSLRMDREGNIRRQFGFGPTCEIQVPTCSELPTTRLQTGDFVLLSKFHVLSFVHLAHLRLPSCTDFRRFVGSFHVLQQLSCFNVNWDRQQEEPLLLPSSTACYLSRVRLSQCTNTWLPIWFWVAPREPNVAFQARLSEAVHPLIHHQDAGFLAEVVRCGDPTFGQVHVVLSYSWDRLEEDHCKREQQTVRISSLITSLYCRGILS